MDIHSALASRPSIRGEMTILIGRPVEAASVEDPMVEVDRLQQEGRLDRMDAIKAVAKRMGLPKREVYRLAAERGNSLPGKRRD